MSLSWALGNGAACPDCERQLVFGLAGVPLGCVDLGVPKICPGFDHETYATVFQAPMEPGTRSLFTQSYTSYDCADAEERFIQGGPKRPIGVLHIAPSCAPASCAGLDQACGHPEDGCGGLLQCGSCPDGKRCTPSGQCKPLGACEGAHFEVEALRLNGHGSSLAVEDGPVVALLRWRGGITGEDAQAQVVVGLGEQAAFCREVGPLPPCDAPVTATVGGFLDPPQGSGTHPIRAALLRAPDCAAAMAEFGAAETVGILRVGSDCVPGSCETLGVECGVWGDGCGHPLACGACAEGESCAPNGRCGTACSQGVLDVDAVEINQSGAVGSAAPGQAFPVSLHWTLGNPDDCEDCDRPLILGVGETPGDCTLLSSPPTCPDTTDDLLSGLLDAPAEAGEHTVYLWAPTDLTCVQAAATYPSNPERLPVGTLHVTDGCVPETCLTLGAGCGLQDDQCGFTLDCGGCSPGDLCLGDTCACFAHDAYEPNDVASEAHDLGTFGDADAESTVSLTAMVEDDTDWFLMGAVDEMWASDVRIDEIPAMPYTLQAVYLCSDGTASETLLTTTGSCTWTTLSFTGVQDVVGPVAGWRCESTGAPLDIELSPDCPTVDDSGRFFVSIGTTSGCSAYALSLHL